MEERTLTSYRERMGRREDEKESEREDRNYHIKGGERRPKERNVQTSKQGDHLSCMQCTMHAPHPSYLNSADPPFHTFIATG